LAEAGGCPQEEIERKQELPFALRAFCARFRPVAGVCDPLRYWGSAWRGALGWALADLVCPFLPAGRRRAPNCVRCPLRRGCAYGEMFGAQPKAQRGSVAPYALAPVVRDGRIEVRCVLFGDKAASWAPAVLKALMRAGESRRGVGGVRFALEEVWLRTNDGWRPLQGEEFPAFSPAAKAGIWRVEMCAPLRIKRNGRLVRPEQMNGAIWLAALTRRVRELACTYGDLAKAQRLCNGLAMRCWSAAWRWRELVRYSSRQRASMAVGGLVGGFFVEADARLAQLLALGEWTHLGKLATMGHGRYALLPEGE